jgi:hypothetical protein
MSVAICLKGVQTTINKDSKNTVGLQKQVTDMMARVY